MKSNGPKKRRTHDLTIEEIKMEKGFEQLTDEQADEVRIALKTLSILAFEYVLRENQLKDDE